VSGALNRFPGKLHKTGLSGRHGSIYDGFGQAADVVLPTSFATAKQAFLSVEKRTWLQYYGNIDPLHALSRHERRSTHYAS
jgi:hypothetical protein